MERHNNYWKNTLEGKKLLTNIEARELKTIIKENRKKFHEDSEKRFKALMK